MLFMNNMVSNTSDSGITFRNSETTLTCYNVNCLSQLLHVLEPHWDSQSCKS